MPADFLDTSALAKHYHPEAGSAEIERLWLDPAQELYVSSLSAVEILSVFAGKARAGTMSVAEFHTLRKRFAADLTKRKRLLGVRLLLSHYRGAQGLFLRHGLARRLRTLDALQLAVALDLRQAGRINRMISADRDLLAVAALEGLDTFDPENP